MIQITSSSQTVNHNQLIQFLVSSEDMILVGSSSRSSLTEIRIIGHT